MPGRPPHWAGAFNRERVMTMAKANTTTKAATNTNAANDVLAPYAPMLKGWAVKLMGEKPTAEHFAKAHAMGVRVGTKGAVALAMYFRAEGATQGEVTIVNGGPYLNVARQAVTKGLAARVEGPSRGGHKVYRLALPVAKAKAPSKPRKPRAKVKAKPAPEATPAATNEASQG